MRPEPQEYKDPTTNQVHSSKDLTHHPDTICHEYSYGLNSEGAKKIFAQILAIQNQKINSNQDLSIRTFFVARCNFLSITNLCGNLGMNWLYLQRLSSRSDWNISSDSVKNIQFFKNWPKIVKVPYKVKWIYVSFPFRYGPTAKNCAAAMELLQPKIMLPPYHLQNYCLFYYWRTKPITLGAILCQVLTQFVTSRSCSGYLDY